MSRASPALTSFNSGEWGRNLDGRHDLGKYASSCRLIENFLLTVQGPAVRRGGSRFVQAVKDSDDRTWLVKFEFSATVAYVLEFGDEYVRFYTQHGVLESSPGTPYEIVSPYAVADLTASDGTCNLRIVQSGDVLYIAHALRTYAPRKLTRLAATNWAFTTYQPNQGPLLEQNGTATTIYASGSTGSVTLEASTNIFAATDVGRLVRLDVQNLDVKPWEVEKSYSTNDLVRYDGKTYKALNTKTSGTLPPTHERGSAYDGQDGVQWEYQDAGYGLARITAYTDGNTVTASVITDEANGLKQFPAGVVSSGNATKRWQLGAWSDTTEWPASVTFHRSRLWWGGRQRFWASVPNDFENMTADFLGEVRADSAIWSQIQAEDVDDILWLVSLGRVLVLGTGGGEFVAQEITTNEPLGPGNIKVERESKNRAAAVPPVVIGKSLCYVQRAGRKLMSFDYDVQVDGYPSDDLAVLNDRITRPRIIAMAFQGEPSPILWCVLSNGRLRAFTYDRRQDVKGWARHPIGGSAIIESAVTIPSPDGGREELWFIARRTVDGETVRYVEYLERPWEGPDEDDTDAERDEQEDAFYVDSGLTYDGAAVSTITGIDHLVGETVQILADGATHPDRVVDADGEITLDRTASVVHVGLACPAQLVTMRIETGSSTGASQGKVQRVYEAVLRFLETLGGKTGIYGRTLQALSLRSPATPMDQPPPIASADSRISDFPGDYTREGTRIVIRQDQPLPMTVAAIYPRMVVE
jgi:hypothetical protein